MTSHKTCRPEQPRVHSQRGLTLLEVIVSLSIFALSVIGIVQMTDKATGDIKNTVVAEQLRKHGDAARSYIKDNYATVAAAATPTQPFLITTSMLVSGGYLATGTPATNGFGQSTCTLVLEPTLGKLQGLVVTEGGTTLDDLTLGDIVALVGASGGAVRASPAGVVTGAQGGWSIPVANYSNLPNQLSQKCDGTGGNVQLTAGHPAMALWFENGFAQSSVLYRDAVPGMPELNTVNTPIVFNSVQTTGTACSTNASVAADSTGAVLSCQGGIWKTQGSAFWQDTVPNYASLPACNAALNGSTRVVLASTSSGTPRAHTCSGGSWQALAVDDSGNLNLQGILSAGRVQLNEVVVENTVCNSNGANARNIDGQIVSCRWGVWRRSAMAVGDMFTGRVSTSHDDWAVVTYDSSGGGNAAATSVVGSAYVNDVYLRSTGRWMSQASGSPKEYWASCGHWQLPDQGPVFYSGGYRWIKGGICGGQTCYIGCPA